MYQPIKNKKQNLDFSFETNDGVIDWVGMNSISASTRMEPQG